MKRVSSRHLREWVLIALLLGVALVAAIRWGWLERADFWFYDASITSSARAPAANILILAIDEPSLARVGRWPWPRSVMVDVMERLASAGAGPVLLDVIFSEPQRDDTAADLRLAAAVANHGRVVLPVFMPDGRTGVAPTVILPVPGLATATHLGHAQALVDSDGVSRRYLSIETAGGVAYPHVAQVLLDLQRRPAQGLADSSPKAVLVPFAGPSGHFARRSVSDLLDGRIPAQEIKDHLILLGATATGLGDNLATPLAGSSGTMPGVEFVANVLDGLQAGIAPLPASAWTRFTMSLLLLLSLMVALAVTTPRVALGVTVLACALTAMAAILILKWWGWWWPPAVPVAAMALAYPLWSWRRLEASLTAMTRETGRIAAMAQPGQSPSIVEANTRFFDPVETRIAAITQAVDQIANALATDGSAPEAHQHREDMMRHLAHDLRSPLVSLRSLAANLSGDRRAENVAMLQRIDQCAQRALDLSEQFLLMGRAEALDPAYFGEIDLVQILHQSADNLFDDARSTGSQIARQCDLDYAPVRGDARLLQRALLNLGWNALRHGPQGFTVTLSLELTTQGYRLTVHDEGTGFAPEAIARLSQRYAQTSSANAGFGLGLALARLVAEKHGATLRAERPAAGGFDMVFELPRQS